MSYDLSGVKSYVGIITLYRPLLGGDGVIRSPLGAGFTIPALVSPYHASRGHKSRTILFIIQFFHYSVFILYHLHFRRMKQVTLNLEEAVRLVFTLRVPPPLP